MMPVQRKFRFLACPQTKRSLPSGHCNGRVGPVLRESGQLGNVLLLGDGRFRGGGGGRTLVDGPAVWIGGVAAGGGVCNQPPGTAIRYGVQCTVRCAPGGEIRALKGVQP